MVSIHFSGVYKVPPELLQEPDSDKKLLNYIPDAHLYTNPRFHSAFGGKPYLMLDDKHGADSTNFGKRLDGANKWNRLHFEPNGIFGFLWNLLVQSTINPIGMLERVEADMEKKSRPFLFGA